MYLSPGFGGLYKSYLFEIGLCCCYYVLVGFFFIYSGHGSKFEAWIEVCTLWLIVSGSILAKIIHSFLCIGYTPLSKSTDHICVCLFLGFILFQQSVCPDVSTELLSWL